MDNNTDNKKQNIQDNDNKNITNSEDTSKQDIISEQTLINKDVSDADNTLQDKKASNKRDFKQKYMNKTNIILLIILIILVAGGIIYNQKNKTKDTKATSAISSSVENPGYNKLQKLLNEKKEASKTKYTFKRFQDRCKAFESLQIETNITTTININGKKVDEKTETQKFWYERPNKMSIITPGQNVYSDGKNFTTYISFLKQYNSTPVTKDIFSKMIASSPAVNTIGLLLGFDYSQIIKSEKYIGEENIDGRECNLIELNLALPKGMEGSIIQKLWFAKDNGALVRNYYRLMSNASGTRTEMISDAKSITDKVNNKIDSKTFVFKPSAQDKKFDPIKDSKRIEAEMKKFKSDLKVTEELKKFEAAKKLAETKNPINKKIQDLKLYYYDITETKEAIPNETPATPDLPTTSNTQDNPTVAKTPETSATPNTPEEPKETIKSVIKKEKKSIQMLDIINKDTIIAFWVYPDTQNFLKSFEKFYQINKEKYNIISINFNTQNDQEQVIIDARAAGITFPIYFIETEDTKNIIEKWMIMGIPSVYLIDNSKIMKAILFNNSLNIQSSTIDETVKKTFK